MTLEDEMGKAFYADVVRMEDRIRELEAALADERRDRTVMEYEMSRALAKATAERDEAVGLLQMTVVIDDDSAWWDDIYALLSRIDGGMTE